MKWFAFLLVLLPSVLFAQATLPTLDAATGPLVGTDILLCREGADTVDNKCSVSQITDSLFEKLATPTLGVVTGEGTLAAGTYYYTFIATDEGSNGTLLAEEAACILEEPGSCDLTAEFEGGWGGYFARGIVSGEYTESVYLSDTESAEELFLSDDGTVVWSAYPEGLTIGKAAWWGVREEGVLFVEQVSAYNVSATNITSATLFLTTDPTDCVAGEYAVGIGSDGSATCSALLFTSLGDYLNTSGADLIVQSELYVQTKCLSVESPISGDDFLFFRAEKSLTVTGIDCLLVDGTSVATVVKECDANGANCADIEASITCGTTNTTEATSIDNASVDAGDWIRVDPGTVTGVVSQYSVCVTYYVNPGGG